MSPITIKFIDQIFTFIPHRVQFPFWSTHNLFDIEIIWQIQVISNCYKLHLCYMLNLYLLSLKTSITFSKYFRQEIIV